MEQGEVIVALPFPANAEATEPIVPRVGSLHDPASRRAAHAPGQRRLPAATDVRHDAAPTDGRFGIGVVVPLSRPRCLGRRGPRRARTMTWSRTAPTTHLSWTFAPVMHAATGTPRPSVKMCRFTPRFARSVGFGPVWSPLLAPSPWRCPTTSTPTGYRGGRRSSAPTARRSARTPAPEPTVKTGDDTSSPTGTGPAAPSTDSRCAGGTRSRPAPPGQVPAGAHPAAGPGPQARGARLASRRHPARRRIWLPCLRIRSQPIRRFKRF